MKHLFLNREMAGIVMKAFIFLAIPLIMFTGCVNIPEEETEIKLLVEPGSMNFKSTGEEQNLKITTNGRWTVSTNAPSWLTLSASIGLNDSIITVSAASNPSTSQRNATITVNILLLNIKKTIQVTQEPLNITQDTISPNLSVSTDSLNFIADGGQKPFTITSNTNWTVDINSSFGSNAPSWFTLSAYSGSNDSTIYVSATSNTSTSQRNATITVNSITQDVTPQTIKISQEPLEPYLSILDAEDVLDFDASGESKSFNINSNVDWEVSIDYLIGCGETDWLHVSPSSGKNDGTITVTASAKPDVGDRPAILTVSGGGLSPTIITVSQVKIGYLSVSSSSLSFQSTQEQQSINILSDASLWWVYSSDTWLTFSPTEGNFNGTITVTATANPSSLPRSSTISIGFGKFCSLPNMANDIKVTQAGSVVPEMEFVHGGTFTMGCTTEYLEDCNDNEKPTHEVILSDFYIGKYEVTQGQWREIMGDNPSIFKNGDNYPVEQVSWNDIVGTSGATMVINNMNYYENGYIYKLNEKTGKQYRLPTEAEWEYAARGGGNSRKFNYSGSNMVDNVAWYWGTIPSKTPGNSGFGTQPAGTKAPNELAVYDMSGNVWEWCSDWWDQYNSKTVPDLDPKGPSSGRYRIVRGGSWSEYAMYTRISAREGFEPNYRRMDLGFRLASNSD